MTKKYIYDSLGFNLWYGENHALKNIDLKIASNEITSIIGPSGCGKSTYIKTLNRMVDLIPSVKTTGQILFNGTDIFDRTIKVEELRTRVGMVFQKPNPFQKSIFENVVYGPKIHGIRNRSELEDIAERSLRAAALWDEVKDRLKENAYSLSGGQIGRAHV